MRIEASPSRSAADKKKPPIARRKGAEVNANVHGAKRRNDEQKPVRRPSPKAGELTCWIPTADPFLTRLKVSSIHHGISPLDVAKRPYCFSTEMASPEGKRRLHTGREPCHRFTPLSHCYSLTQKSPRPLSPNQTTVKSAWFIHPNQPVSHAFRQFPVATPWNIATRG